MLRRKGNERHAAWERFSSSYGHPWNQAHPNRPNDVFNQSAGTLFRQHGKTSLKDMERTATGHRKTKRQSDATKTVAPQVLENVDYFQTHDEAGPPHAAWECDFF